MGIVLLSALAAGCVTMAAPPPLPTFGGPATAARGADEVALALGGGASLFPGAHSGGNGWFTRWRRGVSDTWDVGVDVLGAQHSNLETLTTKLAFRHRLGPRLRIEGGVGAADDSNGKAVNADFGITAGRLRPESAWSRYVSLRVAVAHGYPGNVLGLGTSADSVAPPDDLIGIAAIGTSGRIGSEGHFVFEGGYGGIAVRGHSGLGRAFYLGAGLLFEIGGSHSVPSHP